MVISPRTDRHTIDVTCTEQNNRIIIHKLQQTIWISSAGIRRELDRCTVEREKTEKIDRMGNEDEREQTGQGEWAEEAKSETIGRIQSGARGQRGVG